MALARTLDEANAKSYARVIARRRVEDANMTGTEWDVDVCGDARARGGAVVGVVGGVRRCDGGVEGLRMDRMSECVCRGGGGCHAPGGASLICVCDMGLGV